MLANALPQLYALVLSIVAARYLGPSGMGRQSFIAFVEATTITLLSGSFSLALMRYIGEAVGAGRAGAARWLTVRILWIEVVAALIGGGVLVVIAVLGGKPRDAWLLAALAVVSSIVATVPGAVLAGLQRWREATIAGLTTGGVGVAATIVVLSLGGRITAMFAVEAIVTTLALLWTGALARGALGELQTRAGPRARPAPGHGPLRHVLLRRHAPLSDRLAPLGVLLPPALFERPADRLLLDRLRGLDRRGAPAVGDGRGAGSGRRDALRRRRPRADPDRVQPGPAPARPRDAARDSCGCGTRSGGGAADLGPGLQPGNGTVPGHGRSLSADARHRALLVAARRARASRRSAFWPRPSPRESTSGSPLRSCPTTARSEPRSPTPARSSPRGCRCSSTRAGSPGRWVSSPSRSSAERCSPARAVASPGQSPRRSAGRSGSCSDWSAARRSSSALALGIGFLPRADAEWLREALGKRFSGRAGGAVLALAGWRQ